MTFGKNLTGAKATALYAGIAIVLVWALFPLVWVFATSLKRPLDVTTVPPKFIFRPTVRAYESLLTTQEFGGDIPFRVYFTNSVIVACSVTGLTLLLATPAAYSLSRLRPRGFKQLSFLILGFRLIPPIVLVVPLFQIFRYLGLIDTRTSLVIPYAALGIPLAVWMLQAFFLDLPSELEDAAMVDGCSRFRAFWRIVLPLAAPGLAAVAIFTFVLAWNDFDFALPLTTSRAVTLPIMASRVAVEEGILWAHLGAVTTVLVLPVVVFAFFAQRYLVGGLRVGAVK